MVRNIACLKSRALPERCFGDVLGVTLQKPAKINRMESPTKHVKRGQNRNSKSRSSISSEGFIVESLKSIKKTCNPSKAKKMNYQVCFGKVNRRIRDVTKAICMLERKLEHISKDISCKVDTYGKECLHNFEYINVQTKYSRLLDSDNKKIYNFVEKSESDFKVRHDSSGQIVYELLIPESNIKITEEVDDFSDINAGDFVLKILPSNVQSNPIFIKIPQNQIEFEVNRNQKGCELRNVKKVKRQFGGTDFWELEKNVETCLAF